MWNYLSEKFYDSRTQFALSCSLDPKSPFKTDLENDFAIDLELVFLSCRLSICIVVVVVIAGVVVVVVVAVPTVVVDSDGSNTLMDRPGSVQAPKKAMPFVGRIPVKRFFSSI